MALLVVFLARRGGGLRYCLEISRELVSSRNDIIFLLSKNNEYLDEFKLLERPIYTIETYRNILEFLMFLAFKMKRLLTLFDTIVDKHNIRLVYSPMTQLVSGLVIKRNRKHKYKYLLTMHDSTTHLEPFRLIKNYFLRLDIRRADGLIVLSEAVRTNLKISGKLRNQKIYLIEHGVFRYNECESNPAKNGPLVFVLFGRLNQYKGISVFLDSIDLYSEIFKDMPVSFQIIGQGNLSAYSDIINRLIKSGVRINIRNEWVSEEEIANLFDDMRPCFVLPYIEASQSGVIPLGFNMGIPSIVSDVGGLPSQVSFGGGIVFKANDPIALADTMKLLAENEDAYVSLCIEARERCFSLDNWHQLAEVILNHELS